MRCSSAVDSNFKEYTFIEYTFFYLHVFCSQSAPGFFCAYSLLHTKGISCLFNPQGLNSIQSDKHQIILLSILVTHAFLYPCSLFTIVILSLLSSTPSTFPLFACLSFLSEFLIYFFLCLTEIMVVNFPPFPGTFSLSVCCR